jgi:plasmid stabilization system protein ParE
MAADAFVSELDAAIALIADAPERWPELPNGRRRYVMRRFPFILVFRIRYKGVRVTLPRSLVHLL